MEKLSELRALRPPKKGGPNASYAVQIEGGRSGQILVVTSDEPLVAYQLDDPEHLTWPEGIRKPEGVLIGELDGQSYVVFVELKASDDPEKGKKGKMVDATEQLQSMIEHFHPYGRSGGRRRHGDEHHDRWRSEEDVLEVMPKREHAVVGLALFRRLGGRTPPVVQRVGGRDVIQVFAPFHGALRNRLERSFRELLSHIVT
ncbi:hypothetical protein [Archangium sp.]|uniref:hypothetical protein n=1 Tax=Archangium sp. TaxID=1872627 RepID=UPI002D3503F7|nr:hypothetical protein [Archangium sp.]HYO51468.1 hypothetical protein [Archangium sp.]